MAYQADTATEIDSYKGDPDLAIGSGGMPTSGVIVGRGEHPFAFIDAVSNQLAEFAQKKEAKKVAFQKAFSDELKNTSDTAGILEKDTPEIMALQKDLYRYINQKPHVLTPEGATKYQDDYSEFLKKEQVLTTAIQKSKDDVALDKAWQKRLFAQPDAVNQKIYDSWKSKSLKDRQAVSPLEDPSEALTSLSNTFFKDNSDIGLNSVPLKTGSDNADGTPQIDPYHNMEVTTIKYTPEIESQFIANGKKVAQQYYVAFDQLDKGKKDELVLAVKATIPKDELKNYDDNALLIKAKEKFVEDKIRQFIPKNDRAIKKDIVLNLEGQKQLAQEKASIGVQASNEKTQYRLDNTPQKEAPEDKAERINYNIQLDIDKVVPSSNQPKKVVDKAESNAKINNLTGQLWDISIPMTSRSGAPTGKNESLIDISPSLKLTINRLLENPKHILMQVDSQGKRTYFASDDGVNVEATKYTTPTAIQEAMFDDKDMNKRYDIAYPEASDNKEKSQPSTPTKQKTKIDVNTPLNKIRIKAGLQPI